MNKTETMEYVPTVVIRLPFIGKRWPHFHTPIGIKRTENNWNTTHGLILFVGRGISDEVILARLAKIGDVRGKYSALMDHYLDRVWRQDHPEQYVSA